MKVHGTLVAAFGRHYEIELDEGRRITGIPLGKKSPYACGDRVDLELATADPTRAQIVGHAPRRSLLYRSDAYRQKLIAAAKKLKTEIPEVETVTVGQMLPSKRAVVDSTYDVGFVMRFASQAALDSYEQNPIHQKAVKEQLQPMAKKVQVYDFVIE